MTTTTTDVTTTVTPYLCVRDADRAIEFYREAFGAVETTRIMQPDGRVGHLEFGIGAAVFMMADEFPEMQVLGPQSLGGTTVLLHLEIADVDAVFARAVAAGATALRPVEDQFHGNRNGTILDPFGHRWMISTPIAT